MTETENDGTSDWSNEADEGEWGELMDVNAFIPPLVDPSAGLSLKGMNNWQCTVCRSLIHPRNITCFCGSKKPINCLLTNIELQEGVLANSRHWIHDLGNLCIGIKICGLLRDYVDVSCAIFELKAPEFGVPIGLHRQWSESLRHSPKEVVSAMSEHILQEFVPRFSQSEMADLFLNLSSLPQRPETNPPPTHQSSLLAHGRDMPLMIFEFLEVSDIFSIQSVNRSLFHLCHQPAVWEKRRKELARFKLPRDVYRFRWWDFLDISRLALGTDLDILKVFTKLKFLKIVLRHENVADELNDKFSQINWSTIKALEYECWSSRPTLPSSVQELSPFLNNFATSRLTSVKFRGRPGNINPVFALLLPHFQHVQALYINDQCFRGEYIPQDANPLPLLTNLILDLHDPASHPSALFFGSNLQKLTVIQRDFVDDLFDYDVTLGFVEDILRNNADTVTHLHLHVPPLFSANFGRVMRTLLNGREIHTALTLNGLWFDHFVLRLHNPQSSDFQGVSNISRCSSRMVWNITNGGSPLSEDMPPVQSQHVKLPGIHEVNISASKTKSALTTLKEWQNVLELSVATITCDSLDREAIEDSMGVISHRSRRRARVQFDNTCAQISFS